MNDSWHDESVGCAVFLAFVAGAGLMAWWLS